MSPEAETGRGTHAESWQEVPHDAPVAPAGMSGPTRILSLLRDQRVLFLVWGDLDERTFTTFPAGVEAILRDLQRRRQHPSTTR